MGGAQFERVLPPGRAIANDKDCALRNLRRLPGALGGELEYLRREVVGERRNLWCLERAVRQDHRAALEEPAILRSVAVRFAVAGVLIFLHVFNAPWLSQF